MPQHDDENLQNENGHTTEQDPCDRPDPPPLPDPCVENPGAPGCPDAEPPSIPDDSSRFLAPDNTIRVTPGVPVSSVAREITVINRPLFLDTGTRSINPETYAPSSGFAEPTGQQVDQIRRILGKYWIWLGRSPKLYDKEDQFDLVDSKVLDSEIFARSYTAPALYSQWTSEMEIFFRNDDLGIISDSQRETWRSSIEQAIKGRAMQFSNDGETTTLQSPLYDHVFSAPQPFFKNETNNIGVPSSTIVSVTPVVNFYEEREPVPETQLQSLYRAYYRFLHPSSSTGAPGSCTTDDRDQKFASENVQVMKEANDTFKGQFNQYVEISIGTEQSGKIAGLASEFKMDKYFLEMMAASTTPLPGITQLVSSSAYSFVQDERRSYGSDMMLSDLDAIYDASASITNDRVNVSASAITTLVDPLYKVITGIKDQPQDFFNAFNQDEYPLKFEYSKQPTALRFTDTIRSQIFMSKMEEQVLLKENIRSIADIFNGVKSYSEVIAYRISKHEVIERTLPSGETIKSASEEPIQNFYISDSNDVLNIQFVDTQVNPGKSYVYRIYTVNLVIGALYNYDNNRDDNQNDNFEETFQSEGNVFAWKLKALVQPDIRIIEAPFYEEVITISERPPIPPQASFVPIQGIDNKMEILLQSNFDSELESPISIFPEDEQRIADMSTSQPTRDDGRLEYKTDSLPEMFQVLRMDSPPESYQDFAGASRVTNLSLTGRTYLFRDEDFEPNKDYYYCFRTIDKVGVSNPSFVFKVRLNSYENGIYLTAREYEMVPLEDMDFSMSFQRALKIEPSFVQRSLNIRNVDLQSREYAESAPALANVEVGNDPDGDYIWGRKFKVRLTSKHSCKKVDINLDFSKSIQKTLPLTEEETSDDIYCSETNFGNMGNITRHRIVTEPREPVNKSPETPDGNNSTEAYTGRETARYRLYDKGETKQQCQTRLINQGYRGITAITICAHSTKDNPANIEPDAPEAPPTIG